MHFSLSVNLGVADCPSKGALGLDAELTENPFGQAGYFSTSGGLVVGLNAGVAYAIPTDDVQATFNLSSPKGWSLVVVFNELMIVTVTLVGDGAPQEMTRQ